jgi:hypothetical protein
MATRSYIGVRNTDDSVSYIYCHFDGYPEHNGEILVEHYTSINKVNELLKLGDLSVLGADIGEKHNFDSPRRGWCRAYRRDRGESNTEAKSLPFSKLIENTDVDYIYVFDGDYWECYRTWGKEDEDKMINLYNSVNK